MLDDDGDGVPDGSGQFRPGRGEDAELRAGRVILGQAGDLVEEGAAPIGRMNSLPAGGKE